MKKIFKNNDKKHEKTSNRKEQARDTNTLVVLMSSRYVDNGTLL